MSIDPSTIYLPSYIKKQNYHELADFWGFSRTICPLNLQICVNVYKTEQYAPFCISLLEDIM